MYWDHVDSSAESTSQDPVQRAIDVMVSELWTDRYDIADYDDRVLVYDACQKPYDIKKLEAASKVHPVNSRKRMLVRAILCEVRNNQSPPVLCLETACFLTGLSASTLRRQVKFGHLTARVRNDGLKGYSPDELEAVLRDTYRGDFTESGSLLFEKKYNFKLVAEHMGQALLSAIISEKKIAIGDYLLGRDVQRIRAIWLKNAHGLLQLFSELNPPHDDM